MSENHVATNDCVNDTKQLCEYASYHKRKIFITPCHTFIYHEHSVALDFVNGFWIPNQRCLRATSFESFIERFWKKIFKRPNWNFASFVRIFAIFSLFMLALDRTERKFTYFLFATSSNFNLFKSFTTRSSFFE